METATQEQINHTATVVKKTYDIVASPEVLKRLDAFLAYVQHCSNNTGRFRTVGFDVDGGGSEQIQVLNELPEVEETHVRRHRHGFFMYPSEGVQ